MTQDQRPRIAITMGDPAGVGPEITLQAIRRADVQEVCRPVVVGDRAVLQRAASVLGDDALLGVFDRGAELVDLANVTPEEHTWGRVSQAAGNAAAAYIETAVRLALDGSVAAIATNPVNKESLQLAGVPYPGHTEMIAALTNTPSYAMMLVGPRMRVIHVSTHVSLAEAIRRTRQPRILEVIRLAHGVLKREGLAKPRIAVAGLNPHAGEGGLFGTEEQREIRPAVEAAVAEGIAASGPHPPDTVFLQAHQDKYDIVVAMYHDQGHIPAKLIGFDLSVNVTVGTPIIRTSVDHGTAFDIAGQGLADERSLVEAIRYAARLAGQA